MPETFIEEVVEISEEEFQNMCQKLYSDEEVKDNG
jgi:hypothetical protein